MQTPPRHLKAGLAVSLIVACATLLCMWLDRHVPLGVLTLIYIVALLCIAYRYAFRWAALAAVACVALLNLMFVHPRGTLQVGSGEHGIILGALLLACLLAAYLAAQQRQAAELAKQSAYDAGLLRELAGQLAVAADIPAMLISAVQYLHQRFGSGTIATVDPDYVHRMRVIESAAELPLHAIETTGATPTGDIAHALRYCVRSGQSLGPGTGRWQNLALCCVPLIARDGVLGAVAVPQDKRASGPLAPSPDLHALAAMLAGAIQRERLRDQARKSEAHAESQALRNTLLASVAHDFRTPLAAIIGAASSLLAQRKLLSDQDIHNLTNQIEHEARYLATVTENALQWVRLNSDAHITSSEWQSLPDITGSVIGRLRKRLKDFDVKFVSAADTPLVQGDEVLLAQMLDNLLDNAYKYGGGSATVAVRVGKDMLCVDVSDRGRTLSAAERDKIFDGFYRSPSRANTRGAGLGLTIARAVAEAHGGSLVAMPRLDGGNIFRVLLPLPEHQPTVPDISDNGPDRETET